MAGGQPPAAKASGEGRGLAELGVRLGFTQALHGPVLTQVVNTGTGTQIPVSDSGFFVVVDDRLLHQADFTPMPEGGPERAVWRTESVSVELVWGARQGVAHLWLTVTALGRRIHVGQVGWQSRMGTPVQLGQGQRQPPEDLLAPVPGVLAAHPIWLGADLFAGLDWPVAENACAMEPDGAGRILCRVFPGTALEPGQSWTSPTLTFGAAEPGAQAAAFTAHIQRLRGRPTRRASFYFDWLTHSSEGPTDSEMAAMVNLFARLWERYGLHFDIYALDDGAVETRWGLYWDRYRLQHRRRFPGGLEPLARRLRELGTDLGVWIGPDGFGPNGEHPRADDLVAMIQQWNVGLFKIDTCVSWPWRDGDAAANDAYLRRFAAALSACREARPDLIAINHRVTSSPYVLTMLDSTLWEGAESYPDVFLNNTDRPRLHTRYAAYGRGLPTYYGAPSDLLEDHGVCFNGDPAGWQRELCVGAFGRALALSPEIYGTLFLLDDSDYPDLAAALALVREWRPVLSRPGARTEDGDFVHTDGQTAVLCLLNDGWTPTTRRLRLDAGLGLTAEGTYSVVARFPRRRVLAVGVSRGDAVEVALQPFEALAVEIVPGEPEAPWADVDHRVEDGALILSAEPGTDREVVVSGHRRRVSFPGRARTEPEWVDLGQWTATAPSEHDATDAEACRFELSNDPAEWQVLAQARSSEIAESQACRAFFREKLRREGMGVAANAWDGDVRTAWGDAPHWTRLQNLWRLDLGSAAEVGLVEIDLADFGGGPVFTDGDRRGLQEPIWLEASEDLRAWVRSPVHVFFTRNAMRTWPSSLIGEFPLGTRGRYLRLRVQGIAVQDIRVHVRTADGGLIPLDRTLWRGTNLWGDRAPEHVYRGTVRVRDTWPGRTLAVVAQLAGRTPLQQEVGLCWARVGERLAVATVGSPRPLFHSYEWDSGGSGPGFVWRLPVTAEWIGADVAVSLGWIGARGREGRTIDSPTVCAYLLSDEGPKAELGVSLPPA